MLVCCCAAQIGLDDHQGLRDDVLGDDVTIHVTCKKSETEIFESPQSVLYNFEHIFKDVFSSRSH